MLTAQVQLVAAGVMTGTDVVNNPAQQVTNTLYMSIQCVWTGTPTGVFKIQATNDAVINASTTTWSDLTTASSVILNGSQPAGSASNCMFNNNATGVPWNFIRLVYTNASGTGSFNAFLNTKGA